MSSELREKIFERTVLVGVVGLGYVGIPLARTLCEGGYSVRGIDSDYTKVQSLRNGKSYLGHVSDLTIKGMLEAKKFEPTSEYSQIADCDVVVICLPTPVGSHNEPDMSIVFGCLEELCPFLKGGVLLILESTTYPGATEGEVYNLIMEKTPTEARLFLAFSPEREDPGNEKFKTKDIPKLVGGVDEESGSLAAVFYEQGGFRSVVKVQSARIAESAKLVENTYRAVNIALVNELKKVFDAMGVDVWEVLDAASTKPFGFQKFTPGPGIGGHCIPVDPFYLTWKSKEVGVTSQFVELAGLVNSSMPSYVVSKVRQGLNSVEKSVRGSKILLLGIAYKPDVDDMREAPALEIWDLLAQDGALIEYHDNHIPSVCATRKYPHFSHTKSVDFLRGLTKDECDCIVLLTPHKNIVANLGNLSSYDGVLVDTTRLAEEGRYTLVLA